MRRVLSSKIAILILCLGNILLGSLLFYQYRTQIEWEGSPRRYSHLPFAKVPAERRKNTPLLYQLYDDGFRIKGTYYWQPRAATFNFWNSFVPERASDDFAQLEKLGFNTVVFTIPWGEFQTSIDPISYDEERFSQLEDLFLRAWEKNLYVILRVGSHQILPQGANGGDWFAATVLTNRRENKAYRDLLTEVARRTRHHPNLLLYFWTWEDTSIMPFAWYAHYQENVDAFRQWL